MTLYGWQQKIQGLSRLSCKKAGKKTRVCARCGVKCGNQPVAIVRACGYLLRGSLACYAKVTFVVASIIFRLCQLRTPLKVMLMKLFKSSVPKINAAAQIFYPKNKVKNKVGSGGLPTELLSKADEAVVALKEDYCAIVEEQLENIWKIFHGVQDGTVKLEDGIADIMQAAFNFKGEARSFGYPMIGQLGGSLYRFTDANPSVANLDIIKLHLEAIGAVARHKIQDDSHPIAKEIAKNLEIAIAKFSPK